MTQQSNPMTPDWIGLVGGHPVADLKDYYPVDTSVRVGDNRPLKGYYMGYTEMGLITPNGSTTLL
jgi:hypothetical protein